MFETEIENPTENLEVESSETESPEQTSAVPIVDLDSVEKFRYAGREWTPKDFQGAYMMQSDYTKKTQAISEERKYYDNLQTDLDQVKSNPQLAAEFRKVYPEKFHKFLGYVTPAQAAAEVKQAQQSQSKIDPEMDSRLKRVESIYENQTRKAAESDVDSNCEKFSLKYSNVKGKFEALAMDMLGARLSKIRESDPDASLSEKDWDSVYKSIHTDLDQFSDRRYAEKVKKQTQANSQGRDMAGGGGTPGTAPKNPRTIKEASASLREALENS